MKRLLQKLQDNAPSLGEVKRSKKRRLSGSEDEDFKGGGANSTWTPKNLDFSMSGFYNASSRNKPAELFRKDLISAMKLPDNEQLTADDFWALADSWKQEWEKGVQVPVNPDALPCPSMRKSKNGGFHKDKAEFKLPKKLIRITHDEFFTNDVHHLSNAPVMSDQICRYDMDDVDCNWLSLFNQQRTSHGLVTLEVGQMELVMEELETQCYENMQKAIQAELGLGIEYDEDVVCDICQSPESEDGNEMVFCDVCNVCVHQACYGIDKVPEGSWLCRTCSLIIKPDCILCPNKGGAMKCTRSNNKWAHVSCALWIPEVSIGCAEKMEPITKISQIPPSRWALICCLCKERVGACIQCSVKACKTAYHVTCAFINKLEMEASFEEDGIKLTSFCPKHTKRKDKKGRRGNKRGNKGAVREDTESSDVTLTSGVSDNNATDVDEYDSCTNARKRVSKSEMKRRMMEEKQNARNQKLHEIESEFYKFVDLESVLDSLRNFGKQFDSDLLDFIFHYWKLKRKAAFNKPLLTPKAEESDLLSRQQENSLYARMKMFVHLRQDLERVRNLCYMVSRREKIYRTWIQSREEIFEKQVAVLTDEKATNMTEVEIELVAHSSHGPSIYDRLQSQPDITKCCQSKKRSLYKQALIYLQGGGASLGLNGLKPTSDKPKENPYAKTYLNGLTRSKNRVRSAGYESGNNSPVESAKNDDSASDGSAVKRRRKKLHGEWTEDFKADVLACRQRISSEEFFSDSTGGFSPVLNELATHIMTDSEGDVFEAKEVKPLSVDPFSLTNGVGPASPKLMICEKPETECVTVASPFAVEDQAVCECEPPAVASATGQLPPCSPPKSEPDICELITSELIDYTPVVDGQALPKPTFFKSGFQLKTTRQLSGLGTPDDAQKKLSKVFAKKSAPSGGNLPKKDCVKKLDKKPVDGKTPENKISASSSEEGKTPAKDRFSNTTLNVNSLGRYKIPKKKTSTAETQPADKSADLEKYNVDFDEELSPVHLPLRANLQNNNMARKGSFSEAKWGKTEPEPHLVVAHCSRPLFTERVVNHTPCEPVKQFTGASSFQSKIDSLLQSPGREGTDSKVNKLLMSPSDKRDKGNFKMAAKSTVHYKIEKSPSHLKDENKSNVAPRVEKLLLSPVKNRTDNIVESPTKVESIRLSLKPSPELLSPKTQKVSKNLFKSGLKVSKSPSLSEKERFPIVKSVKILPLPPRAETECETPVATTPSPTKDGLKMAVQMLTPGSLKLSFKKNLLSTWTTEMDSGSSPSLSSIPLPGTPDFAAIPLPAEGIDHSKIPLPDSPLCSNNTVQPYRLDFESTNSNDPVSDSIFKPLMVDTEMSNPSAIDSGGVMAPNEQMNSGKTSLLRSYRRGVGSVMSPVGSTAHSPGTSRTQDSGHFGSSDTTSPLDNFNHTARNEQFQYDNRFEASAKYQRGVDNMPAYTTEHSFTNFNPVKAPKSFSPRTSKKAAFPGRKMPPSSAVPPLLPPPIPPSALLRTFSTASQLPIPSLLDTEIEPPPQMKSQPERLVIKLKKDQTSRSWNRVGEPAISPRENSPFKAAGGGVWKPLTNHDATSPGKLTLRRFNDVGNSSQSNVLSNSHQERDYRYYNNSNYDNNSYKEHRNKKRFKKNEYS